MDEQQQRTVEIKLRMTVSERAQIEKLAQHGEPLAPVLRGYLLALTQASEGTLRRLRDDAIGQQDLIDFFEQREEKKESVKVPAPKIDPQLLRTLSGIGNNVNQIAKYCNTMNRTNQAINMAAVAIELGHIAEALQGLRLDNQANDSKDF